MKLKKNRIILISVVMLLGTVSLLAAQITVTPSGYVTGSVYAKTNDEPILDAAGLRGALNLDGTIFSAADFHLSMELYSNFAGVADDLFYSDHLYYPGVYELSGNERTLVAFDLKEAWVGCAAGDFDIAVGKQLVTWGQADGTNPTDNINPRYIGVRSVSTSAEKKLGVPLLTVVYNLPSNGGNIQAVFIPLSVPNQMPPTGSSISEETPSFALGNMEGGVRALLYPGSVSISASYLTILDRYPSDVVELKQLYPSVYVPSALGHNRQHIIGFDAVYLVGGFDLRTEWAYTLTKDTDGSNPYEKNPFVSGVVQGSRSFFNATTTVSLSWAPQYIVNFEKPVIPPSAPPYMAQLYVGQGFEFENMIGLRLQSNLVNETIKPEVMFLVALSAQDYLSTIACSYNIADGWNIKGGYTMYGSFRSASDPERQLGTFGNDTIIDKDSLYLELRFDF